MFVINREAQRNSALSQWEGFAKLGVKTVTPQEIQILITTTGLQDSPIQMKLRKNQNYVTTEIITYKDSANQITIYGYCYRQ